MLQRRFKRSLHISHQALLWLVLAQLSATLVHMSIIPVWLTVFTALIVVARFFMAKGKIEELNKWKKAVIMVLAIAVFVATTQFRFTVEIAVSFFVLAYGLKMLELKFTRDAFLFGFLTIFLLTLGLLFSQSVFISLYVFMALGICFLALMSINSHFSFNAFKKNIGSILSIMGLAIPLLIIFYLAFPRFGPLWSMPLKSSTAFTGLGENVSPGDVANLARSEKRAFRVAFRGNIPEKHHQYWRSLVLDHYNGISWTRSFNQQTRDDQRSENVTNSDQWDYEITVDPHNRHWGFALKDAAVVKGTVFTTPDNLVRFPVEIKSPAEYRILTDPRLSDISLTKKEEMFFLRVPSNINPQANKMAENIVAEYGDTEARIFALLQHFNQLPYFYTLNPPLLTGRNRVDDFMFGSRRGFCEHYASSMAYMLRKMNIPSRLVVGYLGGEWNQSGEFLVVHQYDAHAWVEAWIDGKGWVKFDPTAAVAPSRIEQGIREAVAGENSFLEDTPLSLARFNHIGMINWMRDQLEVINYKWIKLVVNYDFERQQSLFSALLGKNTLWRMAYLVIALACIFFLGVVLFALVPEWRRRQKEPVHFIYSELLRKLSRLNPEIHTGLTPRQLIQIVSLNESDLLALKRIIVVLERILYSGQESRLQDVKQLKSDVRRFKPGL